MSQLATQPSGSIPPAIAHKLHVLRRQVLTWLVIDGMSRWLLLLIGLIGLDLLVDWLFHLDFAQRAIMLGLCVLALLGGAYRWLVRPLLHRPSDDALCLQVENKYGELREVMISSLQFSRMQAHPEQGLSLSMIQATIEQGVEAADAIDFGGTVDQKRFRLNASVVALCLILLSMLGVAVAQQLPLFEIWFNRNVLLGEKEWWRDTYLVVEGVSPEGTLQVTRGEDHLQVVTVREDSKVFPEKVFLEFRDGGARAMEEMKPASDAEGRTFELLLRNVATPFRFRAVGGRDGQSDWVQIVLVDAPAVESLQMMVEPPEYTREEPYQLPAGSGPYHVLEGSGLRLSGTSNKPLQEGTLKVAGQSWPLLLTSSQEFTLSIPADQLLAGTYEFHLVDETGLTAARPDTFDLRIKPDREPRIAVRTTGVSGMVVPRAQIPVEATVTDDYAVTSLKLVYEWRGGENDSIPQGGEVTFNGLDGLYGFPELEFSDLFDLEELKIPTGAGLKFFLVATDNDQVSGAKEGQSSEILLRVVTEEELRTDLLRREREQRQELERILKNQEDLLIETTAMLADVKSQELSLETLRPQMQDGLLQMNRAQKVVGTNVSAIASRFQEFLIEVINNRIDEESGTLRKRLQEMIIVPLEELDTFEVQDAVRGIELSRRSLENAEDLEVALGQTVETQRAIVATIKEVLEAMVKAEGYQEAVNLLNEIKRAEEEVLRLTKERREQRIRELLERGGVDSGSSPDKDPDKPEQEEGAGDDDDEDDDGAEGN